MSTAKFTTPLLGALFEKSDKVEGSKSPDFTGSLGDDKSLKVSAWYTDDHEGLSLKFSSKTDDGYEERGTGDLVTNAEKKAENHPDVKGTVIVDGVELAIAGWNKLAKSTQKPFISLKISEPFVKGAKSHPAASSHSPAPATSSKPPVSKPASSAPAPAPANKNRYEGSSTEELDDIFDFSKE